MSNELLTTLKALGDPTRLRIFRLLGQGPLAVNELREIVDLGQSTVSRHLKVLADAGLVRVRRTGTWGYYSLATPWEEPFQRGLSDLLESTWKGSANGDSAALERVQASRQQTTSAFFRDHAPVWDDVRDEILGPPSHWERLLELVGDVDTAVDLGTGTGALLQGLALRSRQVVGVDSSPEMLERAEKRVRSVGLTNVDLRLGRLEHLPLSDGESDCMVANLVLHHVPDVPTILKEIGRGLRPGGRLWIADLCAHGDQELSKALGAWWPGFETEELRTWLKDAGLQAHRVEELEASSPRFRANLFLMEVVRPD